MFSWMGWLQKLIDEYRHPGPHPPVVPPSPYVPPYVVPPIPPIPPPPSSSDLVVALNFERVLADVADDLVEHSGMSGVAQAWAESMATAGTLDHGNWWSRISAVMPGTSDGEDIAWGQTSIAQVVGDWIASPGHRRQILNPSYRYVGVGRAVAPDGSIYWVADFSS